MCNPSFAAGVYLAGLSATPLLRMSEPSVVVSKYVHRSHAFKNSNEMNGLILNFHCAVPHRAEWGTSDVGEFRPRRRRSSLAGDGR